MDSTGIRNQKGSLSALIPACIIIAVVGIGMFAMDISHNITVRSELQNGADAAALAGARDLVDPELEGQCSIDAIQVAASNTADGTPMQALSNRSTVTATYQMDSSDNSGTCTVDAQMKINNLFAKLVGHNTDNVNVRAQAIGWSSINRIDRDQVFPLAVSVDTTVGNRQPLWKSKIGDVVTFDINSQQYKNSAFTSFEQANPNASWLNGVMDQMLGITAKDGSVPQMQIGDTLNFINGDAGQKHLAEAEQLQHLQDAKELVLPVMEGDPPYNQSRKLVGFITVHIENVDINQSGGQVQTFTAKLVKGVVKGRGGKITGAGSHNSQMEEISPGTVKLSG